ncbi:hypothetical protein PSCFBP3800_05339 [Pseudomonas syringae group genomosp. 3]|uniref:Uncharacterized protein n=1 Tax=Pseudomonas syringae group genomosp. 3 TaxID=251701 RepID=A0A2K4WL44_9PSED|nr:hypothetical protein PSYMP_05694 [Pseudomonas amygdali pv. morsprunorum str. M302280]SOS36622.1 hypothetical protein CFBP6411_05265 [Pseudomonas syringae group genomosp. 3]SPF20790.1 hypothetical protein PSCFBP3800_05339 [Pseudomonas syringae group genomosp. 3]
MLDGFYFLQIFQLHRSAEGESGDEAVHFIVFEWAETFQRWFE